MGNFQVDGLGLAHPMPELCHIQELCLLPEERGNCFGEILRFRYDLDSDDCVGFLYTGCGQNANAFLSYESCARACGRWKNEAICEFGPESGNGSRECGDQQWKSMGQQLSVPKWHFNAELGKCAMFFWSGCGGNGNRFQRCTAIAFHSSHHFLVNPNARISAIMRFRFAAIVTHAQCPLMQDHARTLSQCGISMLACNNAESCNCYCCSGINKCASFEGSLLVAVAAIPTDLCPKRIARCNAA